MLRYWRKICLHSEALREGLMGRSPISVKRWKQLGVRGGVGVAR